jgi:hypothetical protein
MENKIEYNPWLLWIRPLLGSFVLNSTRMQNGLILSYGSNDDMLTHEEVGQLLGGN